MEDLISPVVHHKRSGVRAWWSSRDATGTRRRKLSVLLVGDSLDRNIVQHFCNLSSAFVHADLPNVTWDNSCAYRGRRPGVIHRGKCKGSSSCSAPNGVTVSNFFIFGLVRPSQQHLAIAYEPLTEHV